MSSKKKSVADKGLLNLAEKSFILGQLREKYSRHSSIVAPANERKNKRLSLTSQTREVTRGSLNFVSPETFKKPTFREVVIKAAQYEPFRENLDVKAQRRLSGLGHQARFAKFRQIASRWKVKSKKETNVTEILPEAHYEIVMPEKVRFCATLSTEAQYAIFKGYEDALVHRISTSLPPSKEASIKRAPSANAETRESDEKISPFTILEKKPKIVLVPSSKEPEMYFSENNELPRGEDDRNKRYMTAQFEKAMELLDEITHNSCMEHTGTEPENEPKTAVSLERNIRQYHAWSQQWTKHFEFSC